MSGEGQEVKGILTGLLTGTPLAGLGVTPKLAEKDIVIELTDTQFKDIILKDAQPRARESVSVEFHEGKMTLKIRLW